MSLKVLNTARFHDFSIDRFNYMLQWRDQPISLNKKTFDLLLYLIDHRDRLVTKEELLANLWPDQFVEESNLTQHVFLLRKAFSAHGVEQTIVQTVPRRGYRFTAPIEEVNAPAERMVLSTTESITRITVEEEEQDSVPSPALAATPSTDVARETTVPGGQPDDRSQSAQAALAGGLQKRGRLYWSISASLVLLAVIAAGWFGWQRWLDRTSGSPVDVVLAPTTGSTGDVVLDQALGTALRIDLSQSPFVSVVSPARVRATLTEMQQKPGSAMTPAVARDVCERTNSQAVLQGEVARVGQHFLLTEEATSCVSGSVLAEEKREASSAEDLPLNVEKLAESLRRKLGESRRSIARFDVPLLAGDTASLEALKDYSQATMQADQGKFLDAIELLKKSVAADSHFAEGYYDLAAYSQAAMNVPAEREAILKAYSLRDSASEPKRLAIIALYHSVATQNLYEAERNYRNWTELYPRSALAWNGLSVVERYLGRSHDAVAADQHALDLRPSALGVYVDLADDQLETGDNNGARTTCERAIARGLDGDYIREPYFEAAYALHDAQLTQKQREWETAHPDAVFVRTVDVEIAIQEGRFSDANRLTPQVAALMHRLGMGAGDNFVRSEAVNVLEAGDVVEGTRLLHSVPADPEDDMDVIGLVRAGEFAAASSSLQAMKAKFPDGTVWNDFRGPEIQALIAMGSHKPNEAIEALDTAPLHQEHRPAIALIRADAYLADGKPALAEESYRQIAESTDQNSSNVEIPLSWLGLGRALNAEGKRSAAVEAYQHFFKLWSHADPGNRFLMEGKREFKTLAGPNATPVLSACAELCMQAQPKRLGLSSRLSFL